MGSLGMPEVLLLVAPEDAAVVGDEVGDIVELGAVGFDDGAGHDADGEFLG